MKTAAEYQKAYRDRLEARRLLQEGLALEVEAGIADGTNGLTCTTTADLWGINFDWGGEQAAVDVLEARANAVGFTLVSIFEELEKMAVKRYKAQVSAKYPDRPVIRFNPGLF